MQELMEAPVVNSQGVLPEQTFLVTVQTGLPGSFMALNLQRRALGLAGIAADGPAEAQLILNLDLEAKEKPLFLLAKLSQSNTVFRLREETASEHTQSLFWVLGVDFI